MGYVDHAGNVAVPIKFDIGHMFSEGLASVKLGGKWGYIDRTGKYVIVPIFDAAMPFCGGVAAVETSHRIGELNVPCRAAIYSGKHGFIDPRGSYVRRDAVAEMWRSPSCD